MSIAAISSPYASAVRRSATSGSSAPAAEATEPVRAAAHVTRELPRRHELLDAMNEVLNAAANGNVADDERSQSVLRFAHALMHDLRTLAGEGERAAGESARASAWGDLPQQLSTLATAASQPAAKPAEVVIAVAEMPDQPNPVTTTTAAVHIMSVPSSRLLEAFVAMHRALGQQAEPPPADEARAALADLVRRLAGAVGPSSTGSQPAGAVLSLKA